MSDKPEYTLVKEITGTFNQCPYKWLFEKYKADCKIFFETGTYLGDSLKAALELGYEKALSVEEDPGMFANAQANLACIPEEHKKKLHLFLGNSAAKMPEMLAMVDSRALFWIDAHYMDGQGAFIELGHIKNHVIKNHVIIVDDIPLYFGDGSGVKKAILDINPDYKFTFETFPPRAEMTKEYHLVAHF
jgi:hypothetical protein